MTEFVLAANVTPAWTDVLTAVGTAGATLIAVILAAAALFRWSLVRPRLTVAIKMEPPDSTKIQVADRRTGQHLWWNYHCRLRIGNTGSGQALDLEVQLLRLFRRVNEDTLLVDRDFMPLSLIWSYSEPPSARRERIEPGLYRHCDLCHLEEGDALFHLDTEVPPNEVRPGVWPTKKPAGHYLLDLAVAADNARPLYARLAIEYTGTWFDHWEEMFSEKGFRVTVIRTWHDRPLRRLVQEAWKKGVRLLRTASSKGARLSRTLPPDLPG